MWSPTHVQVTVQRAKGLLTKGKHGTNDAFVTIGLGKEKFQTSIKEKAPDSVEWHEKCELQIPKQGNTAEIVLTVLHRNFVGMDEFLGNVRIPLAELDVYERPRNRWYKLKDKPGKDKNKERGELEVKIYFTVKSGSLSDLSKKEKHKSSLGQLSQAFGGSLISISSLDKRRGLKKLASKIGRMSKGSKRDSQVPQIYKPDQRGQNQDDADPGVVSDADPGVVSDADSDDGFTLEELSQKGSGSSLNLASTPSIRSVENVSGTIDIPPPKPSRTLPVLPEPPKALKHTFDFGVKDSMKRRLSVLSSSSLSSTKEDEELNINSSPKTFTPDLNDLSIIKKGMNRTSSPKHIPVEQELVQQYSGKSKQELIETILKLQNQIEYQAKHQRDLEEYIDNLLLRVMESSPRILQNPYIKYKAQAQFI